MKETLTEGLQRLLADWDEIIASHEGTADQRAGDEAKRPLFCDECYSRINRFAAGCWKGCAEQLRRTMAAHETSRQVSPGGAMTYTEMDDDTINELNAEVARQRDLWQQPDPDKHLEEADMRPLEVLLERLAVCVRVYEASKRRAARAHGSKPAVGSNPEEGSD